MDPYLVDIARRLESMAGREEIADAMDKLEFLYDALDPEQQDLAGDLIGRLQRRLEQVS